MVKSILVLNKPLFLFLFFIFKYYISTNLYNKLNYKYIIKLFKGKKKNIYFFFIFYFLLLSNSNLNLLLFYFIKKKVYYNINLYNINLYIIIEILKYNIFFGKFKFNYFQKSKNIKIFMFFDFFLRIDILLFITYKYYMNYFRLFKYNEYLSIHPNLYKYPLLRIFLRNFWVNRDTKYHKNLYSEKSILKFFRIYFFSKDINKLLFFNNDLKFKFKGLNLQFNKFKFIKFLNLLKNNNYYFLYLYFGKFFKLHLCLFVYNITIFNYEEDDWVEIKKFRLFSLDDNLWQLKRYGFNLTSWLFMLVLSYISKMFINNYLYLNNLNNLNIINNFSYLKFFNFNIFWYSLIKIILIEKINFYYFFWLSELVLKIKKNKKKSLIRYVRIWHILINSYIFQFINVKLDNYNDSVKLIDYLKNIKFNLDFIFWNIFFIGTKSYNVNFKYNIESILNKINIDSILYLKFTLYFNFLRFFLSYNFSPFFLINFLFFFIFIHDLFIKIFINKKINLLINKSQKINKLIFKKLKINEKLIFNFNFKNFWALKNFDNYKIKNNNWYIFFFENNLIIAVIIIIINKYYL